VIEPQATFSSCFGAPFLPQPPSVYAELLRERIKEHGASAWLVNTGWTGGPYGTGSRMPISATRAIIRAALSGELDDAPTRTDPNFGFEVPTEVPGVEASLLDPRGTWADGDAYDAAAKDLATRIKEHAAAMRG
jgi:phosphoenolpyruvate carboxykinase (ATP)